jgi:tyrosine-protein kinase Etk/Wzc
MVQGTPAVTDPPGRQSSHFLVRIFHIASVWRRAIFWTTFWALVISTVVAFLIPPKFKAVASVFPAEKTDILSSVSGLPSLARAISPAGGLFKTDAELDKYSAILKSGRVLGEVIRKFDLVNVYEITSYPMEQTTKELLDNVDFSIEPEGYISISVYDKDPQRSADMANYFVEMLDRTNREIQAQNARATRIFLEDRYKKNLVDLAAAEDSMRAFQIRYGVIAMPEQVEATVKAGVALAAELAAKEVQLGVLQRTLAPAHPDISAKTVEVDELRKKIAQLNVETEGTVGGMKMMVPYKRIPDLGVMYIRRFREVQIQSKILEILTPLYEQAKVEEHKESPSVIVLDQGSPAERKSKPKRALVMLGGMLLGMIGSFGYAAAAMRWQELRESDSDVYRSIATFHAGVTEDLRAFRARFRRKRG